MEVRVAFLIITTTVLGLSNKLRFNCLEFLRRHAEFVQDDNLHSNTLEPYYFVSNEKQNGDHKMTLLMKRAKTKG